MANGAGGTDIVERYCSYIGLDPLAMDIEVPRACRNIGQGHIRWRVQYV